MTKKKIGIFGYARHGKDTVAELICNKLNYSFCSSSYFVCSKAVFPVLRRSTITLLWMSVSMTVCNTGLNGSS